MALISPVSLGIRSSRIMQLPDWRALVFTDSVRAEPTLGRARIVLWLPVNNSERNKRWERVNSSADCQTTSVDGLLAVPAVAITTQPPPWGALGRLLRWMRKEPEAAIWFHP